MILLDTCTLLWLVNDHEQLSMAARDAIDTEDIAFSAMSIFEIARKYHMGKLVLATPPQQWLMIATQKFELLEIPVLAAIAIGAAALPPLHRDPADRLLVATAQHHDLGIVTPDQHIRQYPDVRTIW